MVVEVAWVVPATGVLVAEVVVVVDDGCMYVVGTPELTGTGTGITAGVVYG
jgi:hypothetical protein